MINWYLNRLKTMTPSEIPYRVRQLVTKQMEKHLLKYVIPRQSIKSIRHQILPIANIKHPLFESNIWVFGKNFDYSKEPINWHKDIFSEKEFALGFAKSMSIRNDSELSAKNVWEINRLEFLPHIAMNYNTTGEEKYLNQFARIVESWNTANPYLLGINWYSNIEVNIRLINWFLCWEILNIDEIVNKNSVFKEFVDSILLPVIYQHCKYSYANPSKFSSANNHLISEYSGLFIAASKWEFKESGKWLDYSKKGLEIEIEKQHSNGINKEEAAEYIQFITDFFLLPYIVGENTRNPLSKDYLSNLKQIFEYIHEFTDIKSNFPKYGDEDDGKVICLSMDKHYNNFKSLMTSAAILFEDSRFKSKSEGFDLKNELLFGEKGRNMFNEIDSLKSEQVSKFYKPEGHFIFRKQKNEKEIYLHFDAAPLGYLSIAAHGHADALSLLMQINGFPIFVDSGTYSYHVSKQWREYFLSTMAHNTVCVDGENQATQAGDTMWLNHYQCDVIDVQQNNEIEIVKASHTGYKKVSHTRTIAFVKDEDTFIITDEIKNNDGKEHDINILFHLHPDIIITHLEKNEVLLTHPSGIKLTIALEQLKSDLKVVKGQNDPLLGWYSESFMQKEPTSVVFFNKKTKSSIKAITKIKINEY